MKIIKISFAIILFITAFSSCEKDTIEDEVGIEIYDDFSEEVDEDQIQPGGD